ncbi:unnamed protein product [Caenorhabditis angaria]|uniref:Uncharacterized protein n=1 Tax=Caenorhabditis angaria TaxID=860376 RepID=A0A9P1IT56_9PELO|nr:unnamed protein product [Caenorhabditis angaria]
MDPSVIACAQAQVNLEEDLDCPFKWINNDTMNCVYSDRWLESLSKRPWLRNARTDIVAKEATEMEKLEKELCCYETFCLAQCGVFEGYIRDLEILPIYPDTFIDEIIEHYPEFFKEYSAEEVQLIKNHTANDTVDSNWDVRYKHLDMILVESGRKRMEDEIKAANRIELNAILILILLTIGLFY